MRSASRTGTLTRSEPFRQGSQGETRARRELAGPDHASDLVVDPLGLRLEPACHEPLAPSSSPRIVYLLRRTSEPGEASVRVVEFSLGRAGVETSERGSQPCRATASSTSAPRTCPGRDADDLGVRPHPRPEVVVGEQPVDRPDELARRSSRTWGAVRRTPSRAAAGRCRTGPRTAGARSSGRPKWNPSHIVLFPPCVISRSHCGRIDGCGRNWSPYMFGPRVIWSFSGPIETTARCSVVASASMSRCISPTSMHPSDPSDR